MSASASPIRSQTFQKSERLTSRLIFESLIKDGHSYQESPFRLIWIATKLDTKFPAQVAFSVPKKNFKSAVHRNRIKRMIREVYRKNKSNFYPLLRQKEKQLAILIVYSGKTIPKYAEVEQKITLILQRLAEIF
ncbi:MAG TPA: ribonuclease P protein component [Bacteroidia bacterium]|nr:ribonuclease P protein component [Bacteroidia bacterium]HNS12817.1 ribonuclease P protein component [Bacteroidia bacterium]